MGEQLDRTIEVVEELRGLLIEGRTLLKDLKRERKQCEKLLTKYETHIEEYSSEQIEGIMREQVAIATTALAKEIGNTQRKLEDRVVSAMRELTNTLMYGNKQGRGRNVLEDALKMRELHDRGL